jgi:L-ascorbate metabolism protein UlaG (beta-lactamase superfamily)
MRVTYLDHSGFLAETEDRCLLFDWWKGELPPLPDKPLLVFASHRHPDHFTPRIFPLDDGRRDVTFLLSKDIRPTPRNREQWKLSDETAARCRFLAKRETLEVSGVTVETLPSTDEGAAFLVSRGGRTIYHAGDLNWWHWAEEAPDWNRNMEVSFKRSMELLRGRAIDLAFAPLDPRLGDACDWGFRYFLDTAAVRRVLPMHQWKDYDLTRRFLEANPQYADRVVAVERPGQSWDFPD